MAGTKKIISYFVFLARYDYALVSGCAKSLKSYAKKSSHKLSEIEPNAYQICVEKSGHFVFYIGVLRLSFSQMRSAYLYPFGVVFNF